MGDADHFTLLLEISQLVFGYDVGLGGLDSPTSNVMLPPQGTGSVYRLPKA